jgi:hypothetical protein
MDTKLTELVQKEFNSWKYLFDSLEGCFVVEHTAKDQRLMIASQNSVPWHKSLKPQYNEPNNKIGYLFPQKKGIKLQVDFPVSSLKKEYVQEKIAEHKLTYIPQDQRAPANQSWWRITKGDDFDAFTLVIRSEKLGTINKNSTHLKDLFQQIVSLANNTAGSL